MIVDAHVHVAVNTYEPVEMLLAQMQYNGVDKALLTQINQTTDNAYLIECKRRFPGRFALACRVDIKSDSAVRDLARWHREGADSIRMKDFERSPGSEPLAIWKKAQELQMPVSVGTGQKLDLPAFSELTDRLPDLKFVLEHFAGIGLALTGKRAKPTEADFSQVLATLAKYPNAYVKIGGIGEISPPPFPFKDIPPYIKMAYDALGPRRLMWGSDWPPVVAREGYRNALRFTMDQLSFCTKDDLDWIFGKTALSIWAFQ